MMRRLVAVLLAFAVILIGPAVRSAAVATPSSTPSTIYAATQHHLFLDATRKAWVEADVFSVLIAGQPPTLETVARVPTSIVRDLTSDVGLAEPED